MLCTFCGHTNEEGVNFCARCGAKLQQPQQPTDSPNMQGSPSFQGVPDAQVQPNPTESPPLQGFTPPQGQPTVQSAPDYQFSESPQGQPDAYNHGQTAESGTAGAASKLESIPLLKKIPFLNSLPLKKVLMIAASVVVLLIAAIIVIPMLGSSGGAARKDHIALFSDRGELIVSGNNSSKFTVDGDIESYQVSLDGKKAVVLVDYTNRSGGDLYFVTTSAATLIADEVHAYQMSDSGNGVVYFTDYDERGSVATLFLYDTSGKKGTLITDDAYYTGYGDMLGVAISPNGKSIGYINDMDSRNFEFTGYIKVDGKSSEKLGDGMFAVAISDGGRHVYYYKLDLGNYEASLHVRSGRNEQRLAPDVDGISSIMFNRDYSEILFGLSVDGERRSFISTRGNERERITGSGIRRLLLPRGTQTRSYSADFTFGITVYGISSFSNFVALTDDGLVYYDKQLEANRISGSSDYMNSAQISNNGKTLYYINNSNRLSSINPTNANADRRELDRNVVSFVASSDGKSVYYVNEDDELYYISGNGSPKRIADDVSSSNLAMSYSGNRLFFLVDYRSGRGGELCFSNNGGNRTRVARADDVTNVWTTPTNAFYMTRDDEVFRSNGNENFSVFHEEVDSIRKY